MIIFLLQIFFTCIRRLDTTPWVQHSRIPEQVNPGQSVIVMGNVLSLTLGLDIGRRGHLIPPFTPATLARNTDKI